MLGRKVGCIVQVLSLKAMCMLTTYLREVSYSVVKRQGSTVLLKVVSCGACVNGRQNFSGSLLKALLNAEK